MPQIQEQIIENVQVIPRELFPEHFDEREIPDAVSPSRGAAHAAPAPVNEFLASIEQPTNMCERIEKKD